MNLKIAVLTENPRAAFFAGLTTAYVTGMAVGVFGSITKDLNTASASALAICFVCLLLSSLGKWQASAGYAFGLGMGFAVGLLFSFPATAFFAGAVVAGVSLAATLFGWGLRSLIREGESNASSGNL